MVGLFIVMRFPEHNLKEKGLILDHGLGGFSLSLAGPIALGTEVKLHSMRECG